MTHQSHLSTTLSCVSLDFTTSHARIGIHECYEVITSTVVMDLDEPIKISFMGIGAININGFTINSLFDIPVDVNLGSGNDSHSIRL